MITNKRIYKKRLKKRYGIKTFPKGVDIKWISKYVTYIQDELTRRVYEKLDNAILYGLEEQEHGNSTDNL